MVTLDRLRRKAKRSELHPAEAYSGCHVGPCLGVVVEAVVAAILVFDSTLLSPHATPIHASSTSAPSSHETGFGSSALTFICQPLLPLILSPSQVRNMPPIHPDKFRTLHVLPMKDALKAAKLKVSGNKNELIDRYSEWYDENRVVSRHRQ